MQLATRRDKTLLSGKSITASQKEQRLTMVKFFPLQYLRQVKAEMLKVTWPTRRETAISTVAVFVMVFVAAMFLFAADQILSFLVHEILRIGT